MNAEVFPTHEVAIPLTCRIPFPGAEAVMYQDPGEFSIKKDLRGKITINGKQVHLWLSWRQLVLRGQWGSQLRDEITNDRRVGLSPKILDHFVDHPHDWPESWKKDQWGCTPRICFWGGIFRYLWMDSFYVCYGYWGGHEVIPGRLSLGDEFDCSVHSALLGIK